MRFRSTRRQSAELSFTDALLRGLAPDGGLYVPTQLPRFDLAAFDGLETAAQIAARMLEPFFVGDRLHSQLGEICQDALDFPLPLRELEPGLALLELFHGPTAAFKDVGARFLAACMQRLGDDDAGADAGASAKPRRTILVATSGDTGGAIAAAFHRRPGIDVGILFPEGGVSARQQHQLTCWGDNVVSLAVRGVFDDCQHLVKSSFADESWRVRHRLTSANSINIGRLLPQTVYYASTALAHHRKHGAAPRFVVPSGNVGNACAALWAKAMGFPLGQVVLSVNANRPVPDFFESGRWSPRSSVATLANAMDVGNPSNMERVFDLYTDRDALSTVAASVAVNDATIRDAIIEADRRWSVVLCPHTATAAHYHWNQPQPNTVLVATAHPAKFETVVEPLIGRTVPPPPALAALFERPSSFETIDPLLAELQASMARSRA